MKKKERARKELALGRALRQSGAHKTLRPPDLSRKQKGEVLIMWSITMCRSKKSQYAFETSVKKRPNSDVFGVLHAEISLQGGFLSPERNI